MGGAFFMTQTWIDTGLMELKIHENIIELVIVLFLIEPAHDRGGVAGECEPEKEGRIFDSTSLGLTGIRERVLLLGGEAVVSGAIGPISC
jgi:hypothetical protein